MRVAGDPNSGANGVFYTLGDHLGSTSLITNASGGKVAESRYMPWGETRFTTGYQPSNYLYTGQREEAGIGLYYYNARWYDPSLGRFTQADTIIPGAGNPQMYDRYAYVSNNTIRYTDPSGRCLGPGNVMIPDFTTYCSNGKVGQGYAPATKITDGLSSIDSPKTGISGQDLYDWYLSLSNNWLGWWFDVWGQDGTFSWSDFLSLIIYLDASGQYDNQYVPEASIRAANSWCIYGGYGHSCSSPAEYMNQFAWYYDSAGHHINEQIKKPGKEFGKRQAQALQTFSADLQNPDEWSKGCAWNRPCGWANVSLYSKDIRDVLINPDFEFAFFAFVGGNPKEESWFIASYCVSEKWLGGQIASAQDLLFICSNVRSR